MSDEKDPFDDANSKPLIDFKLLGQRRKEEENQFYLVIAGSRGFTYDGSQFYKCNGEDTLITNLELADSIVVHGLGSHIEKKIIIIQGGAKGADFVGHLIAQRHGWEEREYKANWQLHGKKAGYIRNEDMYTQASIRKNKASILFWDGESRGTRHDIFLGVCYGVPTICYNYVERRYLSQKEMKEIYEVVQAEQMRYL